MHCSSFIFTEKRMLVEELVRITKPDDKYFTCMGLDQPPDSLYFRTRKLHTICYKSKRVLGKGFTCFPG